MNRRRHRDPARAVIHRSKSMTPEQVIAAMRWAGFTARDIATILVSLGFKAPR